MSRGHKHVGKTLNDWALSLLKSTLLVATGGIRNINLLLGGFNLEIVSQGDVINLDSLVAPLSEKLWLNGELGALSSLLDLFSSYLQMIKG